MRVKMYEGTDIAKVASLVRQELGEDAVILSEQPVVKGGIGGFFGKGMVQVIAADRSPDHRQAQEIRERVAAGETSMQLTSGIDLIEDGWDAAQDVDPAVAEEFGRAMKLARQNLEQQEMEPLDIPAAPQVPEPSAQVIAAAKAAATQPYQQALAPTELEQMPDLVQQQIAQAVAAASAQIEQQVERALGQVQHTQPAPEQVPPQLQACAGILLARGVQQPIVTELVEAITSQRAVFAAHRDYELLMRETLEDLLAARSAGRGNRIAIVGSGGSGKTSLAIKMARAYAQSGMTCRIVSLVTHANADSGIGPNLSRLLAEEGVRCVTVADFLALKDVLAATQDDELLLFDTPSECYGDAAVFTQTARMLEQAQCSDVLIALSMTSDVSEAQASAAAFEKIIAADARLAITRLDESRNIGQLLNFVAATDLPVALLSDGPREAADVRAASRREIVELLMN